MRTVPARPGEAPHRVARAIDRQLQHRQVRQALLPIRELGLQHTAFQVLPLPDREVPVLDRQLRQRRGQSGTERRIERLDLLGEHVHRPPVGDDVVHVEDEHEVGGVELDQHRADERASSQVERPPRLLGGDSLRLALALVGRQAAEIVHRQWHLQGVRHDLHRHTVDRAKRRPERFVAADRLVVTAFDRLDVDGKFQADGVGDVVERTSRHELIEEPQPLLCVGQRHRGRGGAAWNVHRRAGIRRRLAQRLLEDAALLGGQRCDTLGQSGRSRLVAGHGLRLLSSNAECGRSTRRASSPRRSAIPARRESRPVQRTHGRQTPEPGARPRHHRTGARSW